MGKQIYFNDEELEELNWIIPMFENSHQDTWEEKEAKIVKGIIKKIRK